LRKNVKQTRFLKQEDRSLGGLPALMFFMRCGLFGLARDARLFDKEWLFLIFALYFLFFASIYSF